jgi:hypothetical protein
MPEARKTVHIRAVVSSAALLLETYTKPIMAEPDNISSEGLVNYLLQDTANDLPTLQLRNSTASNTMH